MGCPDVVTITRTVSDALPVNTSLYVIFENDSSQIQHLKNGEKIKFRIISYHLDTVPHLAVCRWATYDAKIELVN